MTTVDQLRGFLADFDGDARITVNGVRDGLKYHFPEMYGKDKPSITVCVEGTRDYQSVQDDIDHEEELKQESWNQ